VEISSESTSLSPSGIDVVHFGFSYATPVMQPAKDTSGTCNGPHLVQDCVGGGSSHHGGDTGCSAGRIGPDACTCAGGGIGPDQCCSDGIMPHSFELSDTEADQCTPESQQFTVSTPNLSLFSFYSSVNEASSLTILFLDSTNKAPTLTPVLH
jgi:hypothetical protein